MLNFIINRLKNISQWVRYKRWYLFPYLMQKEVYNRYNFKDYSLNNVPETELLFINDLIDPEGTVIDVGANIGIYLYCLTHYGVHKQIIAFEPLPGLYKLLKRAFPNSGVYPFALSDKNGTSEFHIPYLSGRLFDTRSTLQSEQQYANTTRIKKIPVTLRTLDDFIDEFHTGNINFIKIDVEGHEMATLEGARKTIEKYHPILQIEIEQHLHLEQSVQEIIKTIEQYGYRAYFFEPTEKKFKQAIDFNTVKFQTSVQVNNHLHISNIIFLPISNLVTYQKRMQQIEKNFLYPTK